MTELRWAALLDGSDGLAAGLRGYVHLTAASLGVGPESCTIDPQPTASAYIALDGRLARFPDRDLALLWDERHGWSVCVETHSGEDMIVIAYHGGELAPSPAAVQAFVAATVAGLPVGQPDPPVLTGCRQRESLAQMLGTYASFG